MYSDEDILELATKVGKHLKASSRKVVTAESCSGGWISKALTDVPGSSGWFEFGFVTYSDLAKRDLLGVQLMTLEQEGAVSEPVVSEMANGALERSRADIAVSVSGIAGPDGGVPGKPVGTIWMAWAYKSGARVQAHARIKFFKGDRDAVRRRIVVTALKGILEL